MESLALTPDIIVILAILFATTVLFVSDMVRVDVVAILVLAVLGITKSLPPEQLFSGISSEAVLSLIGIMIISTGLERSGVTSRIARAILKVGREKHNTINVLLMVASGFLATFMRSLGTVALFLPVVTRINSRTGIAKSRLLLPMAFCAILGGTMTMVGTGPLILLNSLLSNANEFMPEALDDPFTSFSLFDVFPIGFALLFVGIVYLAIFSRKLLPKDVQKNSIIGATKKHFLKTYGKGGDIFELKVLPSSPLVSGTLKNLETKLSATLSIVAVRQEKDLHFPPLRRIVIEANAMVAIMGTKAEVEEFAKSYKLKLLPKLISFAEILHHSRAGLCEAVLPPSSGLIGENVGELHMRRNHGLHVIALYRGNAVYHGDELKKLHLRSGDTLGMFSKWEALTEFHNNPDVVVLTTSYPKDKIVPKKMPYAIGCFILALILVVWGGFALSIGLLLGAVGMVAVGVLTVDEAYEAVSWKTVFLLGGLIPLGLAIQTSGTADWITQQLVDNVSHVKPMVLLSIIAVLATLLSLVISNVGATVVLVPIALNIGLDFGVDPRLCALTVALAASNTFLIPTHQVNALIAGPGGYKIADFLKIGGIMTVLYWGVMLGVLYWLF